MKFNLRLTRTIIRFLLVAGVAGIVGVGRLSWAASPTVEQALSLSPIQDGVDYDRPTPEEAAKCKISVKKVDGHVGWVVESPAGLILRKFLDTNGDNVVDQWSYYKDGIEVYRDIDSNFNGKADQYRWFNTGGMRWGLDKNENGKIDSWKVISAEEVTAEVVAALAKQDSERFVHLLLTPDELQSLGLGKVKADALAAKIAKAEGDFKALLVRQKSITPQTKWVQFGGSRPGTVPADTEGSTKDLHVYENVIAIVQTAGKHSQIQIGTLIQVGDVWRVIDTPNVPAEGQADTPPAGFFFQAALSNRAGATSNGPSEEASKLLSQLEKLDQFDPQRPDLLEQLAQQAKTPEERNLWYRQMADTVSAAVQSGKSADGDKRLEALFNKLQKSETDKSLAAYVRFRHLTAQYGLALQAPKADFAKIQTEWLKTLEQYITDYPTAPDTAEAMLQLGIAREFAGQEDDAKKWYGRIVQEFADSAAAKKAAGAITRLECVGKVISLAGKGVSGGTVDLASFRGKVVLIQYWNTWCGPCKADMPALKELMTKYGASFTVLGVSLDTNAKTLGSFLTENHLTWPQIFEEGGLDSRPANQLGILTLPTMILVDQQGKVVNRNIQMADVEGELKKLIH